MSTTAETLETATGIPNGKLGIWLFLASEVMLFGGIISSYIVLRMGSPIFGVPPREMLGVPLAMINTFVLITSSVTMVLALASIQKGNRSAFAGYLSATLLLGFVFLGIKAYEYHHKWAEGITLSGSLFGSFYYTMTGLHGLHVIGGLIFNSYILVASLTPSRRGDSKGEGWSGSITPEHHDRVEYAGLYWHFVDLVWVVLFPLLYLI